VYVEFDDDALDKNDKKNRDAVLLVIIEIGWVVIQIFRICMVNRNMFGLGNRRSEGISLAKHRDGGSNPERPERKSIHLDLEDEPRNQENHNHSDIKLNLSADIKNFEALSWFKM
jgi:hypothetical protein